MIDSSMSKVLDIPSRNGQSVKFNLIKPALIFNLKSALADKILSTRAVKAGFIFTRKRAFFLNPD